MADANELIPLNDPITFDSDDAAMLAADSDEVARAFRDDAARYSDMMSPRAGSLAGG